MITQLNTKQYVLFSAFTVHLSPLNKIYGNERRPTHKPSKIGIGTEKKLTKRGHLILNFQSFNFLTVYLLSSFFYNDSSNPDLPFLFILYPTVQIYERTGHN